MKLGTLLAASAIGCATLSVQAAIVTHAGSTTIDPTYTRPLEDLSGLSAVGNAVRYDRYDFMVGAAGTYSFLTTGTYDTFTALYSPTFNATLPLNNARIANDDLVNIGTSGFTYDLLPGVLYSYITSAFSNTDAGFFSTTIGGIGSVMPATAETGAGATPRIVTITGDTESAPTLTRPLEDLSGYSAVGSDVGYSSYTFRVDTSGAYSFLTTGDFDTFDFLYSPTLDPSHALIDSRTANDDLLGIGTSGFAYDLLAGVDYTIVTTGFANADAGFFSTTIGGPGAIVAAAAVVPEPEVLALLMVGAGAMGWRTRRRKAAPCA